MIREQSKIEEEPELYAGEQPVCNPYHHQRGRAISCNIIGAVFDFFEKKAKKRITAGQLEKGCPYFVSGSVYEKQ